MPDQNSYQFSSELKNSSFLLASKLGVIEDCSVHESILFSFKPSVNELIWNVICKEAHSCLWTLMQKCKFTHQVQSDEVLVERSEAKKWFEINVQLQGASFFILAKDVTAQHLSVERLIEERQFNSIGTLAGGLAHQYNNIHHAVLGFLESSLHMNPEQQADVIKLAMKKLENGADLTKSLLDYTRGHSERGVTSLQLSEVFEQVSVLTQGELLKYGCTLDLPHTQVIVKGNKMVLEQIIANLVINAAQATIGKTGGGSTHEISLRAQCVGALCKVQVRDHGWGISEENRPMIFTPFFSTKGEFAKGKSPYSRIKGRGLSLALSKRFARQFNGDLILKKTSPNGSVFELSIPKGEPLKSVELSPQEVTKKEKRTVENRKLNFLILDDLPENRLVLKFYLKERANKISESESGDVPISELETLRPDVIFVDWLMPGVNGHQFLSSLKRNRRFDLLKRAYILSGFNDSEEIESWKPLIAGVIEKPISREKLLSRVLN